MSQPTADNIIRTLHVEDEFLQEARRLLRSQIPTGFRFSEQVVADGQPQTTRAVAQTTEGAFAKARLQIPDNAKVLEQKVLITPHEGLLKVQAFEEDSAKKDAESHDAIVKDFRLVTPGSKGLLGIGRKPNLYEIDILQQAVVEVSYQVPAKISATIQGRRGDGTILGDLIAKGAYSAPAGSETIGYFSPTFAPFRTFPNGKTGLLGGVEADQQMQIRAATLSTFGGMFSKSDDETINLVVKLCDKFYFLTASRLLTSFQELLGNEAVSSFLLITTTMPFFLTYSVADVAVIAEVDLELKLNGLVNLLLNDSDVASVRSVPEFGNRVAALLNEREEEVAAKKKWAIEQADVRK